MTTKRIKDLATVKYTGYMALDDNDGTGKFPIDNLIGSIAEIYVPGTTNAVAGEFYMYNGHYWLCKEDTSGEFDATKFSQATVGDCIEKCLAYKQTTAATTLQSYTDSGIYKIDAETMASIIDAPDDYISGSVILVVLQASAGINKTQLLIELVANRMYKRYVSGGTAGPWYNYAEQLCIGNPVSKFNYTNFKQCVEYGIYNGSNADIQNITDKPSDWTQGSFSLLVMPANDSYNSQILVNLNGTVWQRYSSKSASNAATWVKISALPQYSRTRLAALGDSITQGYWSDGEGVTHGPDDDKNWPYHLSKLNDWTVTNYGLGGAGYVHKAGISPYRDATEIVDNVDFTQFDIVTLAFGINDWHYSCDIGDISTSTLHDDTMVGNMRYCVETILSQNPSIKIVVIGPFNSSAFGGDFASNWGLGTSLATSGTLQNVIEKIKSVCEYYGIQYIDNINNSCVNRYNIRDVLGDGLHPIQDLYMQIAKCFSKQILFA